MVPENTENANRVGIPYALDDEGKRVAAYDALPHATYRCPYCNCKVFRRQSHKGICSYVRYKDQKHLDRRCERIEKTGKYHSFSASESPEKLIGSMCQCSVERIRKNDVPVSRTHNLSTTQPDDELHAMVYTSLKQIYEAGLDSMRPYEQFGKYVLSDYFIHFKWARTFFNKSKPYNLDTRILQVGITSYDRINHNFLFSIYSGENFRVKFVLHAANLSAFNAIYKKLYVKEFNPTSNKSYFVKRGTQALIAGIDWKYIDHYQCQGHFCKSNTDYCHNCCGLYMAKAVTPKQVFLIPQ